MIKTYHHSQFSSAQELAKLKSASGTSISIIIPALNEEATIGTIVEEIRTNLMIKAPLVDELIVIDGCSTDSTAQKASKAGATVFSTASAGPVTNSSGKGVSLWKSQFVSTGDIVAFIDADIAGFDSRYVRALIGPMLQDTSIHLVKAFYQRPLVLNGNTYDNYGGRVTEILVRPLLASFFPDLAQIRQPLAGEYALRRSVMEGLPFSSGYGVEIGLLLDLYTQYGLAHLAQVDMDLRIHRNRTVAELGKMGFSVLQTLLRRCERYGNISFSKALGSEMISISGSGLEKNIFNETDLPARNLYKEECLK